MLHVWSEWLLSWSDLWPRQRDIVWCGHVITCQTDLPAESNLKNLVFPQKKESMFFSKLNYNKLPAEISQCREKKKRSWTRWQNKTVSVVTRTNKQKNLILFNTVMCTYSTTCIKYSSVGAAALLLFFSFKILIGVKLNYIYLQGKNAVWSITSAKTDGFTSCWRRVCFFFSGKVWS